MKGRKLLSVMLAGTLLATQGCERHEERIFHMIRCTMAASVEKQYDSVIAKSWEMTGLYMRENGIKKNPAELTAITANIRNEIMGPPDSSWDERDARVAEIVNSEFCTAYLNLIQLK
ncbi:hypothetical protein HX794_21260 [Pseudomonas costantinii]|uniref:hypothetical protein n=1 Tax=Pseudomonas costantinii TaxID=168469 RepID=UPI0015A2F2C2|nr:hypothetical protein [Pseudomonas costantinii]NVZ22174.1 hypothetical protein [Pseudomonas costantinii]